MNEVTVRSNPAGKGQADADLDVDVVVVGAGFAGLYQIFRAKQMGLSVRAFERAGGVGGTWYWNRYPGARCDTPSMSYTVSYMPDLDREWPFSELFPAQHDIRAYIEEVAKRGDLSRHITFDTSVESAVWDETSNLWRVTTNHGETVKARFVVMASGTLTAVPKNPEIKGIETFKGQLFHTGRWPHEPVDLKGKRVAIVGTGSTGVQTVGEIAPIVGELTVFQRTPKFVGPANNRPLTPEEVQNARDAYPQSRKKARIAHFGGDFDPPFMHYLGVPEEQIDRECDELWDSGIFMALFSDFERKDGVLQNREANDVLANYVRRKIKQIIKDPETAEKLTPYGYPIAINRPIIGDGWYEAFNMPHVKLVDCLTDPLVEVTPTGMRTKNHEFEFDIIIFATGYDAMTGALTSIDIVGKHGKTLREEWQKEGPSTYLGLLSYNFPNFFMITAPGGPSVLSNAVVTGEQGVDFTTAIMEKMQKEGLVRVEPGEADQAKWTDHVDELAEACLYREAHKANAWYTGANIPGKKVRFMPYCGGVGTYERIRLDNQQKGFPGFHFQ